jgi:polyadenylate-binding protein
LKIQEIGGRVIKVNITEKPLDVSGLNRLTEEAEFIDSPYKVYVGNLAKAVTTETLKKKFAEKGNVLDAKVTRIPETGKSGGYGFVSFSSEADVEAAISAFNNVVIIHTLLNLQDQMERAESEVLFHA